jgi:hypothetical protein
MQRLAFGAGGDGLVAIGAFAGANNDHVLLAAPSGSFTAHGWSAVVNSIGL